MLISQPPQANRQAFSLLELLLVIFIISLVYYLGFEGIEKAGKKKTVLSPLTLKKDIVQQDGFKGPGTLICTDRCRQCYFKEGLNAPFKPIEASVSLKNIKVYSLDRRNELYSPDYGRYKDSKICLVIDFYPNGSSTPVILQDAKGTYFLPSYFGKPQQVDSLEAAQKLWIAYIEKIKDQGSYY